jgi:pyruvate/2-oxoglutarate dehydrogenase complex dihydrolipoamide acyltransferase (E2) component
MLKKEDKMVKKRDYIYEVINISKSKQAQIDYVEEGRKKPLVWAIGHIDVTKPREYFRTHVDDQGKPYSFAAYMAYLLGQAILEHPKINAYMLGRKKLVVFKDVDIVCVVERYFEGASRPVPTSYTIRAAQEKHWKQIHQEIRDAQTRKSEGLQYDKEGDKQAARVKLFTKLPGWIRRLYLRKAMKNPHQKKQFMGTIGLTSIGMFLQEAGNPIAITPNTLSFQVGGIEWEPRFNENGELENREFLSACFAVDHAVIDGGPAARFISTFRQMFTRGHGIDFSEPPNAPKKDKGLYKF